MTLLSRIFSCVPLDEGHQYYQGQGWIYGQLYWGYGSRRGYCNYRFSSLVGTRGGREDGGRQRKADGPMRQVRPRTVHSVSLFTIFPD